ncbi:helix-hairpin-helix domain-containing protein [Nocardioides lijunqiniae]|uniref:helix-hairpin-helix domain-containing protein n=1 Tax=Nocardioides lijunqiniae TaxID=2760832 RepID=UPI001D0C90B8|nr:helix-hairpin-helix domain-containing protein [Nocardioides lijunqiniae]
MRSRRAQQEHDEAVARRLAQLSAELTSTHQPPGPHGPDERGLAPAAGGEWWDGHTRIAPARRPLVVVAPADPDPPQGPPPTRPAVRPPAPPPGLPEVPGPSVPPEPPVPPVPLPGRHAARRRRVLADAVPEPLRGRTWLGPLQVTVVAVLVAVGLAVTTWWVVRGDPEPVSVGPTLSPVSDPLVSVAQAPAGAPPPAPAPPGSDPGTTSGAATTVTVDVAGKVRRPGIQVLEAGARVVDAIEAAGGARAGVDLASLNLARLLIDGEQVLVGAAPASVPGAAPPPAPGGGSASAPVSLNTAGQAELETLPEVGPVTAQAILAWRTEHGGFSSVDELLEVDGIGDATLAKIAPFVTI